MIEIEYDERILSCDKCRQEQEILYKYDGFEYCKECFAKVLMSKVSIPQIICWMDDADVWDDFKDYMVEDAEEVR